MDADGDCDRKLSLLGDFFYGFFSRDYVCVRVKLRRRKFVHKKEKGIASLC